MQWVFVLFPPRRNLYPTVYFTKCDGLQVDGIQEVAKQSPLQAYHIPAQDLITAAHRPQPLAVLDAIPRWYNCT